jgi:hypothetical protein
LIASLCSWRSSAWLAFNASRTHSSTLSSNRSWHGGELLLQNLLAHILAAAGGGLAPAFVA